ncbi:hypothetical protein [Vulgatibacter sp.]|uniref:hypothetical protein n=1 Tax=Vulgatibacter sp. TaxID=1971226 RepID=UPI00356B534F
MIAIDHFEEQLKLPLDRRGFLRRECSTCHRQFKLRWSEQDAVLLLRRLGNELRHENEHEVVTHPVSRTCPYCSASAHADAWWTEEQRLYLSRKAAALGEEIRFEQLRHVERTIGQNPNLTFLPVPPAPFRAGVRAEPDDMRVIPLVCCGEDVKVRDSWTGTIHCPFCGVEHDIQRGHPAK